jgi:hypothetical protein
VQLSQYLVVELSGQFLSVSGNKRDGAALIHKPDRILDLKRLQFEFLYQLSRNIRHLFHSFKYTAMRAIAMPSIAKLPGVSSPSPA